ncbi:MAG: hypothetical protein EOP85_10350, partial [Verrucomicrobiaceae bacterium]
MPAGSISFGDRAKTAAENFEGKIATWNPFGNLASPGGSDLTSVFIALPRGLGVECHLPLQ